MTISKPVGGICLPVLLLAYGVKAIVTSEASLPNGYFYKPMNFIGTHPWVTFHAAESILLGAIVICVAAAAHAHWYWSQHASLAAYSVAFRNLACIAAFAFAVAFVFQLAF